MNRLLLSAAFACGGAGAQVPPHPDPYLPPSQRLPSSSAPAFGAALRAEAMQKLRQRFEQADLDASSSLTVEEARRAGLGFVVQHFDAIDSTHRGKVSFDDLRAYLVRRRAR
ncbi:MAG: EF-hand domain-containing protein [Pseudomonadota bacterium]